MIALLVIVAAGFGCWYLMRMPEPEPVSDMASDIEIEPAPVDVTPIRHGRHKAHS